MDKVGIGIGMVVGATLVMGGLVWSKEQGGEKQRENAQMIEMATAAEVTIDQAIKTALANFPGKVVEAELEKQPGKEKRPDRTVWVVEIMTAGRDLMTVHVDAVSGSVIDTEETIAGKRPEVESKLEPKPKLTK